MNAIHPANAMEKMTKNTHDVFILGHSPDPDDAFMFYAMAENKIDLRGYRFEHRLEDIQTLNERASRVSCTFLPSRFTPMLTLPAITSCYPAGRAWAMATVRL